MDIINKIIKSWATTKSIFLDVSQILNLIAKKNKELIVNIKKIPLSNCYPWEMVKGEKIENKNGNFFSIKGIQWNSARGIYKQPIIIQDEIGFLGIICKEFNGILYFLMQMKIEPGNINVIQLSPTIQATKSNFTQKHGGKKPAYLDYFLNMSKYSIIVDQIQSEQSSRFYHKRNRNVLIYVEDEVDVLSSHIWMTLGQIKELMKYDNIVNMDTRTVLSCIPYSESKKPNEIRSLFNDIYLYNSIYSNVDWERINLIYNYINNLKMFDEYSYKFIPLDKIDWSIDQYQISSKLYDFKVVYCDIEIEGREVRKWNQPLFEASGKATFGLFTTIISEKRFFLVKVKKEIGCFDLCELGPTLQLEHSQNPENEIDELFLKLMNSGENVLCDVILSEEGGRFFHEENRNCIIELKDISQLLLPNGYFWIDYRTICYFIKINNILNIQLRNLISLLNI